MRMNKNFKKTVTTALLLILLVGCSANKSEVRLNPTPQSIETHSNDKISTKLGFKLVDTNEAIKDVLKFAINESQALALTVQFGDSISKANQVPQEDGAYTLTVTKDGVTIIGYNERGAYYGVQTLLQLNKNRELPNVTIVDYPDVPYRGVVEGFYGTPWSHEVRKSLIEYYGKYKMNSYLYGPKDDPYHSSLCHLTDPTKPIVGNWRDPYPAEEAAKIKELVEVSNKNRVDFIWAIHPGQDIKWIESDYKKLLAKFESMYDLGVRSFAVFFDDISGIGTRADKQAELLNRLHKEFVEVKGDVAPLIMCPTDYTKLWADPSETGYLSILGDTLHPSIQIMWTGDVICGDITDETLEWVNSRINRPTLIWWNYPVTDYVKHIILQGPVYGNTQNATKETMIGLVSNPMEHGEASKIALYGVADYTWNISDYNALDNWEHAIKDLMPEVSDAYRTFAMHSTDTETGYRRDESWETTTFSVDSYTKKEYDALYKEFAKIKDAPRAIFQRGKNRLLISELKPWLEEFEKLGTRGLVALDLIKDYEEKDYQLFWDRFRSTIETSKGLETYKAHRSGTYKLTPFINNARKDLALKVYSDLSGKPAYQTVAVGSYENVDTELSTLMLDGNSKTYYTSAESQQDGSWLGVDLGRVIDVTRIYIEQGRNNVDDVDYFDSANLEVSEDGENWRAIRENMKRQYVVDWSGEPQKARYVRIARLNDSKRKNWMAVRRFEVNPTASKPQFSTNVSQIKGRTLDISGDNITVSPILEFITVKPGEYFGVDMPIATAIGDRAFDLGDSALTVEYSVDGENWVSDSNTAKYIRYTNRTNSSVNARLNKFTFTTLSSADAQLSNALDENLVTSYKSVGETQIAVPKGATQVTILSDINGESTVTVAELGAEQKVISQNYITTSLATVKLTNAAQTIKISGDVTLYEVIFK